MNLVAISSLIAITMLSLYLTPLRASRSNPRNAFARAWRWFGWLAPLFLLAGACYLLTEHFHSDSETIVVSAQLGVLFYGVGLVAVAAVMLARR